MRRLRPVLAYGAGILGLLVVVVVILNLGGDDTAPHSSTTTPATTALAPTVPTTLSPTTVPTTVTSPRAAESIEPVWLREATWAGTAPRGRGHGLLATPGILAGVYHEDGVVFGVDMDTGEQLWTTPTSDHSTATLLAIEDGGVVIAGGPGYVTSLDLSSGQVIWRSQFESFLTPIGAIRDVGHLHVFLDRLNDSVAPQVLTLDETTGGVIWETVLDDMEPPGLRLLPGGFNLAGDTLLVSVEVGTFGIDADTGSVRWVADYGWPGPVGSNLPILVDAGTAYVSGPNGVIAIDVSTGAQREIDAGLLATPVTVIDGRLVVVDQGGIEALDVVDGDSAWHVDIAEPDTATRHGEGIYALGRETVAAVTTDGELIWKRVMGNARNHSLLPAGRGLAVVGENRIDLLERDTGDALWSIPRGTLLPPVVRQDRMVVSHGDGSLALYRDPEAPGWTVLPDAPVTPRSSATALWSGSELLGWSGYSGSAPSDTALVGVGFDPTTAEWRVLPEPPLGARYQFHVEMMDGGVALFGGLTGPVNEAGNGAIYDVDDDRWREMAPNEGLGRFDGVWTGHELLVMGSSGSTPKLMAYDPAADSWERRSAPVAGFGGALTWTGDTAIHWGVGAWPLGFAYHPESDTWERIPPAPISRRDRQSATWTGNEVVVFGGLGTDDEDLADGAAYNPTTGEWRRIAPGPLEARHGHQAVWSGSEVLILGGTADRNPDDRQLRTAAAYNPTTDSWRVLPDLPVTMGNMTAVWVPDHGLIVWGSKGSFLLQS